MTQTCPNPSHQSDAIRLIVIRISLPGQPHGLIGWKEVRVLTRQRPVPEVLGLGRTAVRWILNLVYMPCFNLRL